MITHITYETSIGDTYVFRKKYDGSVVCETEVSYVTCSELVELAKFTTEVKKLLK